MSKPSKPSKPTIEEAARKLVKLYRTYFRGFVGAHRIKEWVELCEALDEPLELQDNE